MVVAPMRASPYTSAALNRLAACALCAAFAACSNASTVGNPPEGQFYFPAGIAHVDVPGSTEGALYVANGNFDKRFTHGTFEGLLLDQVGLPAFGAPVPSTGPVQLTSLPLPMLEGKEVIGDSRVNIASFAGELGVWKRPNGDLRFFIPSRSEGDYLQVVDGPSPTIDAAPSLRCRTVLEDTDDCWSAAYSMTSYQDPVTSLPRATAPYGVTVAPDGEVYVTHLTNADSPRGSNKDLTSYIVHFNAETLQIDANSFVRLGPGAVNTAVVGKKWVYLSGRALTGGTQFVRLLNRDGTALLSGGIEYTLGIVDARGLSLSSDETRLYFAGRNPDRLVVASITGADTDAPVVRLMRTVPLPAGPNQVITIPRAGRSDLVAVSCSTAGVVALYDDDLGGLVAQVPGVGLQPFGMAADRQGAGVRLYVGNFADGRVAVIDVPDLEAPQVARVVAHLSKDQLCITRQERETVKKVCP
jgi:DNA-binding beta-propeller fold protein YncE